MNFPLSPVLVVDDEKNMRRSLETVLKDEGYAAQVAESAEEALELIAREDFFMVITDVRLGGMSGYELLLQVRADPALGETPFIMVTAESKTDNVIAARKAGVNNYIVKPFNAQTLRTKIEAAFAEAAESAPA